MRFPILYLFLIINFFSYSQIKQAPHQIIGFGATPSNIKTINGLNFNYFFNENKTAHKTNGVELNNLWMIIGVPIILGELPGSDFIEPPVEKFSLLDIKRFNIVNGLNIGFFDPDDNITNGIELNFVINSGIINGIAITPFVGNHYNANGISISGLGNYDSRARGIQIGLFNKCNDLKGLQIGLWNKNQKRSLPIINWNFKS